MLAQSTTEEWIYLNEFHNQFFVLFCFRFRFRFRSRNNRTIFSFNLLDSPNSQSYHMRNVFLYEVKIWRKEKIGKKWKYFCRKQDVKFLTIICCTHYIFLKRTEIHIHTMPYGMRIFSGPWILFMYRRRLRASTNKRFCELWNYYC